MRFATAFRIAALVLFVVGLSACTEDPLGPEADRDDVVCVWIEGVLHCDDS
jgi:hypothetical protein